MEKRSVNSRGIQWIRYDETKSILEVQYASSKAYRYFDVPVACYEWLLKADSKGKFLNRLVKDKYAYERIDDVPKDPDDLERLLKESIRPSSSDQG
jgi:hypothetical protein